MMWSSADTFQELLESTSETLSKATFDKLVDLAIKDAAYAYKDVCMLLERQMKRCEANGKGRLNAFHVLAAICRRSKRKHGIKDKYGPRIAGRTEYIAGYLSELPSLYWPEVAKAVASWSKESVIPETSLAHFRGFGNAPEKKSGSKKSFEGVLGGDNAANSNAAVPDSNHLLGAAKPVARITPSDPAVAAAPSGASDGVSGGWNGRRAALSGDTRERTPDELPPPPPQPKPVLATETRQGPRKRKSRWDSDAAPSDQPAPPPGGQAGGVLPWQSAAQGNGQVSAVPAEGPMAHAPWMSAAPEPGQAGHPGYQAPPTQQPLPQVPPHLHDGNWQAHVPAGYGLPGAQAPPPAFAPLQQSQAQPAWQAAPPPQNPMMHPYPGHGSFAPQPPPGPVQPPQQPPWAQSFRPPPPRPPPGLPPPSASLEPPPPPPLPAAAGAETRPRV